MFVQATWQKFASSSKTVTAEFYADFRIEFNELNWTQYEKEFDQKLMTTNLSIELKWQIRQGERRVLENVIATSRMCN